MVSFLAAAYVRRETLALDPGDDTGYGVFRGVFCAGLQSRAGPFGFKQPEVPAEYMEVYI